FCRFTVLGFGLLETSMDLFVSHNSLALGSVFSKLRVRGSPLVHFSSLKVVGNTLETGVSGLPTAMARYEKIEIRGGISLHPMSIWIWRSSCKLPSGFTS